MSGRHNLTSGSSSASQKKDVSSASSGTGSSNASKKKKVSSANTGAFILDVECNDPDFCEEVLVIVDDDLGIEGAAAEFEKTIINLAHESSSKKELLRRFGLLMTAILSLVLKMESLFQLGS
ncbi:hypothetical protein BZA77DRAFT_355822 [Pyronema omphalodes]|nr:hypothetical protein BZA77DRAFT_355822 [Pyronema omphalodes]